MTETTHARICYRLHSFDPYCRCCFIADGVEGNRSSRSAAWSIGNFRVFGWTQHNFQLHHRGMRKETLLVALIQLVFHLQKLSNQEYCRCMIKWVIYKLHRVLNEPSISDLCKYLSDFCSLALRDIRQVVTRHTSVCRGAFLFLVESTDVSLGSLFSCAVLGKKARTFSGNRGLYGHGSLCYNVENSRINP